MVNGTEVGRVGPGSGLVIDVPAGRHVVYAKVGWVCRSQAVSIDLAEGQHEALDCEAGGPPEAALRDSFHPGSWILLYDPRFSKPEGRFVVRRRAWLLPAVVAVAAFAFALSGALRGSLPFAAFWAALGGFNTFRAVRLRRLATGSL